MNDHRQRHLQIGKAARQKAPRSSHGEWVPAVDRPDPISLLQAQDESRIPKLVPIKYGRMVASPFAFLRGSAIVMASDLASTSASGLNAQLCGDAHLSNFGLFATPERKLVFDLNDFDEVFPGAWEWDLKRLAASAAVAGRSNGYSDKFCRQVAEAVAATYRESMDRFSRASTLDMWYYHVDAEAVQKVFDKAASKKGRKRVEKQIAKARTKTQEQTLAKITDVADGQRRIVSDPPLLVPFREFSQAEQFVDDEKLQLIAKKSVADAWRQYMESLPDDRRFLLNRYHIVDGALRVGGVGSVGTRCVILLLEARDVNDAIILQLKEAGPSVLELYFGRQSYHTHAERVVVGQHLVQASSDMFLGWHTSGLSNLDFYWRQLKDMKGSADVENMDEESFATYLGLCTWSLARAHARTGDSTAIAGYIGSNNTFAAAIGKFAVSYADQTERDYEALVKAIKSGRVKAGTGIYLHLTKHDFG